MRRIRFLIAVLVIAVLAIAGMQNNSTATVKLFQKGAQEEIKLAQSLSFKYLEQHITDYGIDNIKDLKVLNVSFDEMSMAHTRLQQTFHDVPVLGGELIVHLNSDGSLFTVTDSLVRGLQVNTRSDLTATKAKDIAIAEYGCGDCLTFPPKVDMLIFRHKNRDHLVYRVQLRREDGSPDTAMPVYFIDAHTGKTVFSYDNLQTQAVTGTGVSLYSGTVSINTFRDYWGYYYMEDLTRQMGTFDNRNTQGETLDWDVFRFADTDNFWDSSMQRAGVDAHFGAARTYDYFLNVHSRRGIDGGGGPAFFTSADGETGLITSKVHYGVSFSNAFWNGSYVSYGDGDGVTFSPLTALDIVGHEITHGVTQYSARLDYFDESGALNESISDVFGAMVKRFTRGENANTWLHGDDHYTPGIPGDASRYLDEPHRAAEKGFTADDDPDHYSERYMGTADNGGVHINSGIANKAFYLVAKGGTHHRGGSMTGIGADTAARIWYRALTSYMTPGTNFGDAVFATQNAAAALYGFGSTQHNAVSQAWNLCGVCGFRLSPTGQSFPASGGSGTINVTVTGNCNWTATTSASWIHITSGSSGSGSGTVTYTVDANPSTFPRPVGLLVVAGKSFIVNQAGIPCNYSISPNGQAFPGSGGSGTIYVTASAGCSWAAITSISWIHITSGFGTGNGMVKYTVDPNPNYSQRNFAPISVAGKTFYVHQLGKCGTTTLSPVQQNFTASGGSGSFYFSGDCSWVATSTAPWLRITSGGSGSGGRTITYTVDPNTGGGRYGFITIADRTFAVFESAP
jgi:Zn-dependent metalloprotease